MIPDVYLYELAKAVNSESYVTTAYLTVGTNILSPNTSDTSLSGEFGTRVAVTKLRTNNSVNHNALKTGAVITNPTGNTLYSSALFSTSTNGVLCTEVAIPAGITQTTAFDIEFDWNIIINRQ